ncbi:MAG TPA: flagellar hook-basal body complex protein [Phycisphaerae bacterium]|nr:flagellar hook-basal body complex protein [Phycisphaerae bacterium]HRY69760.1 flagellar hook-basal body complex protein [Phycisphaerae bacterium]HSA29236.1 flagellar hook-basal body complex protein [Phycisphaerae bacterium]
MGLTSAMYTGLTGLNANQLRIDTIGNNVANVNTTAFKGSRANFENQFSLTLSGGSGPSETSGGTNPSQIGLGTMLGSIQKSFLAGSIETTGLPTDMAIEGAGFFIVRTPTGEQAYTRDGSFKLASDQVLVSANGYQVQGYGVDQDFNIVPGVLGDLVIPLGTLSTARATTEAQFDGNLDASGSIATQGTILTSQVFQEGASGGPAATGATLLTNVYDTGSNAPLFAENDVITLSTVRKGANGGRQLPEAHFTVAATSTLSDFAAFLNDRLGINADPAAGGTPGVTIGTVAPDEGKIIIQGNAGTENALTIDMADIQSTNASFNAPFEFTETQEANGESVFTTFIAYDSLGNPVTVDLTTTLVEKNNLGTTWRFYAESAQDSDSSPSLGLTGTVSFNNDGQLTGITNDTLEIDRVGSGALTPLQIQLDFSGVTSLAAPYAANPSTLVMSTQDGYGMGTLSNFAVGTDGMIVGTFTNGLTRSLGQIALATFANAEGLVSDLNNLYRIGPNSGNPMISTPGTLGAGTIASSSLELSNVDLTREFIGLIGASTGFSASGRVISTSNDLLNELMSIAR